MSTTTPVSFSPHHPVSPSSVNELRHQSASRSGLEAAQLHEAKDRQVYGTLLNYTVVTVILFCCTLRSCDQFLCCIKRKLRKVFKLCASSNL